MSTVSFIVCGVLPYLAVLVFVGGMAYRIRAWAKAPQPGKMTLFPAAGPGNNTKQVLAEALLFPSLFKGDKVLWLFSWFFHITLALVFVGHLRVVTSLVDTLLMKIGMSEQAIGAMSAGAGGAAGIVLLATGVLLLLRRFAMQRVREISNVGDFLALLLILAIVVTGNMMRFAPEHFDLGITQAWAYSLVTLSPVVDQVGAHEMFIVHALFAQLLIMLIPFSKILHFGGIFFTQALVKRR